MKNKNFWRRLFSGLTFISGLLLATSLTANQQAINWLQLNLQTDTSVASNSIATDYQAVAEALTIPQLYTNTNPAPAHLFTFLNNIQYSGCEYVSRNIIFDSQSGIDFTGLVNTLLTLQNADGGFGELSGYASSSINTAFALRALASVSYTDKAIVEAAISYLLQNQNPDGSFTLSNPNYSSVYETAVVSVALQKYKLVFNVNNAINAANNYLLSQKINGAGWLTDWETAAALLAVMPATSDSSQYFDAITRLKTNQQGEGSWNGDVYITALALQALLVADSLVLPVDNQSGGIAGVIIDQSSVVPLSGVTVSLVENPAITVRTGIDGRFLINNLLPGTYTLAYQLGGYANASQQITVNTAQIVNLGTVELNTNSSTGVLSGLITDAATGAPVSGAQIEVTGVTTSIVTSDVNGAYSLVLPPETVDIAVSTNGYQTSSSRGNITAGSVVTFSPSLILLGNNLPGATVKLRGYVAANQTGARLSGASININGAVMGVSNTNGDFEIIDIPAGDINIAISSSGYRTSFYTAVAGSGNIINLGGVLLSEETGAITSTINGVVLDTEFSAPVVGATVTVDGLNTGAVTNSSGEYEISNISTTNFNLTVSAVGFVTKTTNVALQNHQILNLDVNLSRAAPGDFDISDVHTHQTSFEALTEVEVGAILAYTGNTSISVNLFIKVINSQNEIIKYESAAKLPLLNSPETTAITLTPANPVVEQEIEWLTERYPVGSYQIIIQAYDALSGSLLAERDTQVEILPTQKIGGSGEFSPPITQLAAQTPIKVTASISNQGNLPIDASSLTAEIRMAAKGYASRRGLMSVEPYIADQGLSQPQGMDTDINGNIYVANTGNNTVSKISPNGIIVEYANNLLSPVDVDIDATGTLYVLNKNNSFVAITPGGVKTEVTTSLLSQQAIEVLDDGRVLIIVATGMFEVDLNGVVTQRVYESGISRPNGIAIDSLDRIYIANTNGNNILRFANNQLSIFAEGINSPYGITVDNQDSLYVTSFSDNALIKITQDGVSSILTNQLAGPYDVKISSNGVPTVSNYTSSQIVEVAADGTISVVVDATVQGPQAADYDGNGNLFIANAGRINIVKVQPSGESIEVASNVRVVDLVAQNTGSVYVLDRAGVSHIDSSGLRTQLASIRNGAKIIENSAGDGLLVSQSVQYGAIQNIDTLGTVSPHLESVLGPVLDVFSTPSGEQYVLNRNSIVKIDRLGNYSKAVTSGLSFPASLVVDATGIIYVAETSGNKILQFQNNILTGEFPLTFRPGAMAINAINEVFIAENSTPNVHKLNAGVTGLFATLTSRIGSGLFIDEANELWASISGRSVLHLDVDGIQTSYSLGQNALDISGDNNGGVLVSTSSEIKQINSIRQISTYVAKPLKASGNILRTGLDNQNQLWMFTDTSIVHAFNIDKSIKQTYGSITYPSGMCFDSDNKLIVSGRNGVFKVNAPSQLPMLLNSGSYFDLSCLGSNNVALTNNVALRQLNTLDKTFIDYSTGLSKISTAAENSVGEFVLMDSTLNEVVRYNAQFTEVERYVGLVRPKGLVFNQNGSLFVVNDGANNIFQVSQNGNLLKQVNGLSPTAFEYLNLDAAGNIIASGRRIQSGGDQGYYVFDSSGVLIEEVNNLKRISGVAVSSANDVYYVERDEGVLYRAENRSTDTAVASGIANASDIESDSLNQVYISDNAKNNIHIVNEDNSLTLSLKNLPSVSRMFIDRNDTLFALYNNRNLFSNSKDGVFNDFNISASVQGREISGLVLDNNDQPVIAIPDANTLSKIVTTNNLVESQIGDLVYNATINIPALSVSDPSINLNFDNWLPKESGDFTLTIKSTDGSTTGELISSIHVGAVTDANFSLQSNAVAPGDQSVQANIIVSGIDSTNITSIEAGNATVFAESGANGFSVAADTKGNIYVLDTSPEYRILKITPDGVISPFAVLDSQYQYGRGMAVDSFDNLYLPASQHVLKVTPDGLVNILSSLDSTATAVAVDYKDNVYAVGAQFSGASTQQIGGLYKINNDGSNEKLINIVLPKALTIDSYGNFYVINSTNTILKIDPSARTSTPYYDQATFEFEGVNFASDCSNNLLFAPTRLLPAVLTSEEQDIYQLVGDTGEVRHILNGPSSDTRLRDLDVLFYDRFAGRLLVWTGDANGVIATLPVTCGGLDVEAHIITRADVDLSSTNPAPSNITTLTNGTKEYTWALTQVDARGQQIELNMLFNGLTEGETRTAVEEAYLVFNNSFDAANPVRVPITIPSLTASTQLTTLTTIDKSQYGPNTDVNINVVINNAANSAFSGSLNVDIKDASGAVVETLTPQAITDLSAGTTSTLTSIWNTGLTYVGDYTVEVVVLNNTDQEVNKSTVNFILTTSEAENIKLGSSLYADKPNYDAWDTVSLEGRARNISVNAISKPALATLSITDPLNAVILNQPFNVRSLSAGAYENLNYQFTLADALTGAYTVSLNILDETTQQVLTSSVDTFTVGVTEASSITGTITINAKRIDPGDSIQCNIELTNQSAKPVQNLNTLTRLVSVNTNQVLAEESLIIDLEGNTSYNRLFAPDTSNLTEGSYLCIASVGSGATEKSIVANGFSVLKTAPDIVLNTQVLPEGKGRLLILLDNPVTNNDSDPIGPVNFPLLSQQRNFLENKLSSTGWSYTITSNSQDFVNAFHQGGYTDYALFNERIKLKPQIQKELGEAVYRGSGLLVAGGVHQKNNKLERTLGIKFKGQDNHDNVLSFITSPLNLLGDTNLGRYEHMARAIPKGSSIATTYKDTIADTEEDAEQEGHEDKDAKEDEDEEHEKDKNKNKNKNKNEEDEKDDEKNHYDEDDEFEQDSNAAVLIYHYGKGRSIYTAFDLLAQTTDQVANLGHLTLLDQLMDNALSYIDPQEKEQIPNKMVPLKLTVNNQGDEINTRLKITAPISMQIVDGNGGTLEPGNVIYFDSALQKNQHLEKTIWLQLANNTQAASVLIQTQVFVDESWTDYNAQSIIINPVTLPSIAEAEQAFDKAQNADKPFKKARLYFETAKRKIKDEEYNSAIKYFLEATESLEESSHAQSHNIRLMIDNAIRETAILIQ